MILPAREKRGKVFPRAESGPDQGTTKRVRRRAGLGRATEARP